MLDNDLQVPSLISFFSVDCFSRSTARGFSLHLLRPRMLQPAATLPVHAGHFRGLLGAMEVFEMPGCTWKN